MLLVVSVVVRVVSVAAPVRCRFGVGVAVGGGRTVMPCGVEPAGVAPGVPADGSRSAAESAPTGTWPVIICCVTIW